jgi:hypothetical protein
MTVLAVWRLAKPFLPYIAGLLALVGAYLWIDHHGYQRGFHKRDAEAAALNLTIANMKAASEQALANARATNHRIEAAQNAATQESSHELQDQLAAARAAAAAYAERLRSAEAAPGGTGQAGASSASDASRPAAGTSPVSVMDDDDFRLCSENTVKAIGWRAWWLRINAIPRDSSKGQ